VFFREVKMPRVSVVLPCFNSAGYIRPCLQSLKKQTLLDFEVVVVDDGSTDATAGIVAAETAGDPRFRLFVQRHQGVVSAMNSGIKKARAKYVARMDSDDLCRPERLEKQARFLDSNPRTVMLGSMVEFGGDREKGAGYAHYVDWANSVLSPDEIYKNRFVELSVPNPSAMFRVSAFKEHGLFDNGDFPEDYEFFLRLLDRGAGVEKIPERLLVWNDPHNRLSRTDESYSREAFFRIKSHYLARWLKRNTPGYPEVGILGAGRSVRKKIRPLLDQGIRVRGFFDVSKKRALEKSSHILPLSRMPAPGELFILSYVGSRDSRDQVRDFMQRRGYCLGRDYLLVA
jgi:glycosyltransferase involved in cell wall biosynthesis